MSDTSSNHPILTTVVVMVLIGVTFLITTALDLYTAWVAIKFWGWYSLTAFMATPTLWQMFGIIWVLGLIRYKAPAKEPDDLDESEKLKRAFRPLLMQPLATTLSWFIGWAVWALFIH